jgi:hypothetical protein
MWSGMVMVITRKLLIHNFQFPMIFRSFVVKRRFLLFLLMVLLSGLLPLLHPKIEKPCKRKMMRVANDVFASFYVCMVNLE